MYIRVYGSLGFQLISYQLLKKLFWFLRGFLILCNREDLCQSDDICNRDRLDYIVLWEREIYKIMWMRLKWPKKQFKWRLLKRSIDLCEKDLSDFFDGDLIINDKISKWLMWKWFEEWSKRDLNYLYESELKTYGKQF